MCSPLTPSYSLKKLTVRFPLSPTFETSVMILSVLGDSFLGDSNRKRSSFFPSVSFAGALEHTIASAIYESFFRYAP